MGFALLVFGTVFISMAIPRASLGLRNQALRGVLAAAPASGTSVIGSIDYDAYDIGLNGTLVTAEDLARSRADLSAGLARLQLPLAPSSAWSGFATGFAAVSGAAPRAINAGVPPQLEVIYRDQLNRYGRLAQGRLPAKGRITARHVAVLQIAVTGATAARFGLRPGSRLAMKPGITMEVTGIIRPADPGSAFWAVDPVAAGPELTPPGLMPGHWIGAAFVSPAEVPLMQASGLPTGPMQLSWDLPLSTAHITVGQLSRLEGGLTGAVNEAGELVTGMVIPTPVMLSTGLLAVLAGFSAEDQAIGSVLGLLFVSLAAIGIVTVLLGAGLLAGRRGSEFAMMRARGASLRQVAALALGAAAVLTLPAAAAGGALAAAMTPGDSAAIAWWLAGCALIAAVAGLPLIAAGRLRRAEGGGPGRRAGRAASRGAASRRAAAARRLVAEGALAAAAVAGIIVLRRQGLAAGTVNLYSSAAPALVAIPAAIVVVRGYPVVLRLLLRLAGARPGVSAFVGLARATRTSLSAIVPVFALVLALAVVAFGTMIGDAVHRGEVSVSWREAGADAVINASGSTRPLSPAVQREIAAVPGVARTATVILSSWTLGGGSRVLVAVVNPSRYAALIAGTPGPAFPASAVARPAGPAGPARVAGPAGSPGSVLVPALASPAVARALSRHATRLSIGSTSLTIRAVGTVGRIPGVGAGLLVVLPDWALGTSSLPPSLMLVVGPHLDGRALTGTVRRALPGAAVTLRSDILAALTGAPLPHGADVSIAESAGAAAAFSALILLISLLITARSRDLTLARLATMGLGRGQARWLAVLETLPQVLAATVGGVASAWALAPLVGPAINLSAFTGTGTGVPIRTEPLPLAACAAGLVLLSVLALAAQAVITGHRGAARALRAGD
jgi:putative ABC transport system permease protein